MSEVKNWTTLAKTSVASGDYIPVTGKKKFQLQSLFPALATAGVGSENLYKDITSKNQLNFKGIKSGDTGLLTVATVSDNIVFTVLEAGIDLSQCDNSTSAFLSTVNLASNVTGTLPVANGGTNAASFADKAVVITQDSGTDTLSAVTMSTNGQLLVGGTSGPTATTLTAGTGMTITNGDGTITLAASPSTATANIDMDTYNIDLDAASGNSFVSGDGSDEGLTVDANGRVSIGDSTPTFSATTAQLSLQGSATTAIEIGNTNTYKTYSIDVKTAASGSGAGLSINGAAGGSNSAGGSMSIAGGAGTGNGTGGIMTVFGGAGGTSGVGGALNLTTYSGSGAGSPLAGVTVTNAQNVQIPNGYLQFSETPQTLTGAGAVDVTSAITWVVTTGANALTLADGVEGQTKYIVMKTDGGDGTLTPSNFAQGTTITFNDVGDSAQLLFTNASWHIVGSYGVTVA
jgi:hypothetical protein